VWVCVYVGFVMSGCFDNSVGILVKCVLVFTVFVMLICVFYCFVYIHIFILISFVCTNVRTVATVWKLNCGK